MRIGLQIPFFSWPDGPVEQLGAQFGAVAERAGRPGSDLVCG